MIPRRGRSALNDESALNSFAELCADATAKAAWREMGAFLKTLPRATDDYDVIHNDNPQRNIMVGEDRIALIDCAMRQFFARRHHAALGTDVRGGGRDALARAGRERLSRFLPSFLEGTSARTIWVGFWYERIG